MKSKLLKKMKFKTVLSFKRDKNYSGGNDTDPTGITITTVTHISLPKYISIDN